MARALEIPAALNFRSTLRPRSHSPTDAQTPTALLAAIRQGSRLGIWRSANTVPSTIFAIIAYGQNRRVRVLRGASKYHWRAFVEQMVQQHGWTKTLHSHSQGFRGRGKDLEIRQTRLQIESSLWGMQQRMDERVGKQNQVGNPGHGSFRPRD